MASAVLGGCGSSSDEGAHSGAGAASVAGAAGSALLGGGGGAPPAGGGAAAGGAGTGSGGRATGASGTAGDLGTPDSIGNVQVIRPLPGDPQVNARFDLVEQAAWDALSSADMCSRQQFGDCTVTTCVSADGDAPSNPPSLALLNAGTITVTSDQDDFSANGTPSGTNGEYAFESSGTLPGAGLLTIKGTGGTVSAFTGTVPFPLAPLLLAPSIEGMSGTIEIPVPRNADLRVDWDARDASEIIQTAVVGPTTTPEGQRLLRCSFVAATGTGTFQGAALALIPATTQIRLFGVNRRTFETAQGNIVVQAAYEMVSGDKVSYPSFVLQ